MPAFDPGTVVYFLHTLCLVVSRLLAFVLFAYHFDPGSWAYPASAVAYHVTVMAVLHGVTIRKGQEKFVKPPVASYVPHKRF